jgi:hypothetical protein
MAENVTYTEISDETMDRYRDFYNKHVINERRNPSILNPERDDEGLRSLLRFAKSHPENWNQSFWLFNNGQEPVIRTEEGPYKPSCGTTMCLAGFQAISIDKISPEHFINEDLSYPAWAAFRLGLTSDESEALFFSRNSNAEEIVEKILNDELR